MNERASGCMFDIGILLFLVGIVLTIVLHIEGAVWIVALGVVIMLVGFVFSKMR